MIELQWFIFVTFVKKVCKKLLMSPKQGKNFMEIIPLDEFVGSRAKREVVVTMVNDES